MKLPKDEYTMVSENVWIANSAKVAPTGDASMPMVFVCVMIASAAVMLCMYRKKNN